METTIITVDNNLIFGVYDGFLILKVAVFRLSSIIDPVALIFPLSARDSPNFIPDIVSFIALPTLFI